MRICMRHIAGIAAIVATLLAGCSSDTAQSLLASAKTYLAKNDNKAAVIQLKNALQKDGNLAEARFLLGKALLDSGDVVSAEKELRKALELKYPADQVVPALARDLVLLGQYKKLDEFANVQLVSAQSKAELQTAIGEGKLALGDTNAASEAFARALAAQPDYAPAQIGQARIVAGNGDMVKAMEMVDAVLVRLPSYHPAWQLKGQIFVARREPEQALAAYQKAVQAKPDFVAGHFALVSLLIQQNKWDEAAKQLVPMRKVAPQQTWYLQALVAYGQNNFSAARDSIQQVLRTDPDNLSALLLAGAIEFELESYAQAETDLNKVLQSAPGHPFARRVLVLTYLRSSQPTKALDALKPVMDKMDKDPSMLEVAGEVFMANGQPGMASGYFLKASALDPGDVRKRTAVAAAHFATGETGRAFTELEQAAAVDSNARADLTLIAALMQQREYDKALSAITKLEKKQPKDPLPYSLRGTVLLAKNDRAGARQSFERALELDPGYFPAASDLAAIDLAERKPDAARQRYERVIAKDPQNRQALLALAALRASSGAPPDEVAGLIKKVIAGNPRQAGPRLALMGYYAGVKDFSKSIAAGQEAMAALPDQIDILEAAAQTYRAAGETNQALSIYNKLASLRPGSPQPYLRMAEVQMAAKNKQGAQESLRKALSLHPDSIEAQRLNIAFYLDAGQQKEAIALAREVQRQKPKQSIGYVFEGDIYAWLKNWTEAAAAYRAGLGRVESTELATKLYGALVGAGNGAAAEQFVATWLKEHPKDGAFRMQVAQTAHLYKDYPHALQQYRKLLETDANDPWVLNNLASVEAQVKDPKAMEHAEKANKLAPNQPAIMDTLGVLLMESGDTARGLDLLQKASAMVPGAASIRLNLAKALIKAGKKDAARKELDELAKLGEKFSGQIEVTQLQRNL